VAGGQGFGPATEFNVINKKDELEFSLLRIIERRASSPLTEQPHTFRGRHASRRRFAKVEDNVPGAKGPGTLKQV